MSKAWFWCSAPLTHSFISLSLLVILLLVNVLWCGMFCWLGLYTHTALYLLITTQTQGKRSEKHLSHFISFTKQGQQTIREPLPLLPMLILCFPLFLWCLYPLFFLSSKLLCLLRSTCTHASPCIFVIHSHDRSYHTGETQTNKTKTDQNKKGRKGTRIVCDMSADEKKSRFHTFTLKLSYFVTVFALQ